MRNSKIPKITLSSKTSKNALEAVILQTDHF